MDERTTRTIFYQDSTGYYSSTNGKRTKYAGADEFFDAITEHHGALGHALLNSLLNGSSDLSDRPTIPDAFADSDGTTNTTTDGD
jgi:hypothetical protein